MALSGCDRAANDENCSDHECENNNQQSSSSKTNNNNNSTSLNTNNTKTNTNNKKSFEEDSAQNSSNNNSDSSDKKKNNNKKIDLAPIPPVKIKLPIRENQTKIDKNKGHNYSLPNSSPSASNKVQPTSRRVS